MTEQASGGALPPAAERVSNVPRNWVEQLRAKLPQGSWRRSLYDTLALPVDEPTEFVTDPVTLAAQLMPKGSEAARAAELLTEAQNIYARAESRAGGATSRATTLQGAVAIAATVLVAGAGLVLDQAKLQGTVGRALFAVLLLGVTVSLVMAGLRALSASSTIHVWHRPTATDIVRRSQLPATQARVQLAAETLIDYGYNTKVAAWKVAYLGAAAWWFRIALTLLVALALLVGIYAISKESSGTTTPKTPTATTPTTTTPTTTTPATTTTATTTATTTPATQTATSTTGTVLPPPL